MRKPLLSMGLDVGTTTTQLIFSELTVQNRAGAFAAPELAITDRKIRYRSPVIFTPLTAGDLLDGEALRNWVEGQYEQACIRRDMVDTGAIIVTGESSRKENAREASAALAGFAGAFVTATAGPHLESRLAARGAGAADYSARTGKTVLHIDIGGGTSNFALIEQGNITDTGCLNVGGRLLRLDAEGRITEKSPALSGLCDLEPGDRPSLQQLEALADTLVQGLEMAAGLREPGALLDRLTTREAGFFRCTVPAQLSFSGGVADCIRQDFPPLAFGDIGPILGRKIRSSRLCAGSYRVTEQAIRATVIGAGCHTVQLSGSTVFCRNVHLPVQNLPAAVFTEAQQESSYLPELVAKADGAFLCFPGYAKPDYKTLRSLAERIDAGAGDRPLYILVAADLAKALGQLLSLMRPERPCLCIDRVPVTPDSYLDVGEPVGPAFPVVVKTLTFGGKL